MDKIAQLFTADFVAHILSHFSLYVLVPELSDCKLFFHPPQRPNQMCSAKPSYLSIQNNRDSGHQNPNHSVFKLNCCLVLKAGLKSRHFWHLRKASVATISTKAIFLSLVLSLLRNQFYNGTDNESLIATILSGLLAYTQPLWLFSPQWCCLSTSFLRNIWLTCN